MTPLQDEAFETATWLTPRVDRFSQITVRTNRCSVPVRLAGRQVRVQLHASDLVVYHGRTEVAVSNDGTLPLPQQGRIAVIGPCADDVRTMLGCYSFPNHVQQRNDGPAEPVPRAGTGPTSARLSYHAAAVRPTERSSEDHSCVNVA